MFHPAADSLVSNDCAEQEEIAQMAHVDAQLDRNHRSKRGLIPFRLHLHGRETKRPPECSR